MPSLPCYRLVFGQTFISSNAENRLFAHRKRLNGHVMAMLSQCDCYLIATRKHSYRTPIATIEVHKNRENFITHYQSITYKTTLFSVNFNPKVFMIKNNRKRERVLSRFINCAYDAGALAHKHLLDE
jgi:hypothetical protein